MRTCTVSDEIEQFLRSESGAITTDWVVMAAAVVGLGIAATAAVRTGSGDLATDVNTSISAASVADMGCLAPGADSNAFACYTGPTIVAEGITLYAAGMPMCTGTGDCIYPPIRTITEFTMSDGQTFVRRVTSDPNTGTTETVWTTQAGDPVETPPPQA